LVIGGWSAAIVSEIIAHGPTTYSTVTMPVCVAEYKRLCSFAYGALQIRLLLLLL